MAIIIIVKMSAELPKNVKNIIHHKDIKQLSRPKNIFQDCSLNKTFCNSFKSNYDIVGDTHFKKKFNQQKPTSIEKSDETPKQLEPLDETNFNTTYCNLTNRIDDGTLVYKLSKQKQLEISRNRRTFVQLQKVKERDEKINFHLKKRLSYFGTREVKSTITFEKQQIQSYPNPELIDLINDNIPEYWKNSLRDNQKRLKRHVKGNTFKKQVAEQMLQTLRGRQRLTSSIPKIKQQYLSPNCSREQFLIRKKKRFSVRGSPALKCSKTSFQDPKNKTVSSNPSIRFQEVYKINYNSAYRWMASELC